VTITQIAEIFGLNFSDQPWELSKESYDVPPPLGMFTRQSVLKLYVS